jgi:hypothetical protein
MSFYMAGVAKITARLLCGYCDAQHADTQTVAIGNYPYIPAQPAGWRLLDNLPVCPAHVVIVKDKA